MLWAFFYYCAWIFKKQAIFIHIKVEIAAAIHKAGLMLVQRLRRWPNIKPALDDHVNENNSKMFNTWHFQTYS